MREHFFIVYDFVEDSRRARCVKILEEYGIRVQYSIFEFFLTKARKIELISRLKKAGFLKDNRGEAFMIVPVSRDTSKKIKRYGNTVDIVAQPGIFSV